MSGVRGAWRAAIAAIAVMLSVQVAGSKQPAGSFEPRKVHQKAAHVLAQELGFTVEFDEPPRFKEKWRPLYPAEAIENCVEGTVVLLFGVDARGNVVAPQVVEPVDGLSAAALATARSWRFEPAKKDGRPVGAVGALPVKFRLPGTSPCRRQETKTEEDAQKRPLP